MRLIYAGIAIALAFAILGFADTITLKNGGVINGTYLGGTARTVRVDDGQNVRTLDVGDILRIEFSSNSEGYSSSAPSRNDPPSSNRPTLRRADGSSSPDSGYGNSAPRSSAAQGGPVGGR